MCWILSFRLLLDLAPGGAARLPDGLRRRRSSSRAARCPLREEAALAERRHITARAFALDQVGSAATNDRTTNCRSRRTPIGAKPIVHLWKPAAPPAQGSKRDACRKREGIGNLSGPTPARRPAHARGSSDSPCYALLTGRMARARLLRDCANQRRFRDLSAIADVEGKHGTGRLFSLLGRNRKKASAKKP